VFAAAVAVVPQSAMPSALIWVEPPGREPASLKPVASAPTEMPPEAMAPPPVCVLRIST
jgi:hypothetical protein